MDDPAKHQTSARISPAILRMVWGSIILGLVGMLAWTTLSTRLAQAIVANALLLEGGLIGLLTLLLVHLVRRSTRQTAMLRQSNHALAQSRSRLNATLEATIDSILIVDTQGRVVNFSTQFLQMWQIPESVLKSFRTGSDETMMPFIFSQLEDPEAFLQATQRNMSQPDAISPGILRLKDGRVFAHHSSPQRLKDCLVGCVFSFRDVTDRHHVDQAVSRSLSLLQTTLESTADGIVVLDHEWTITHYNQKFLTMWKVPELLVRQRDDHQLVQFLQAQLLEAEAFVRQICAEYKTPTLEDRSVWTFVDGRVFERHSQPQWLADLIIGRVVSYRDITEQKQAEAALRQSEARFHAFMNYSPLSAWISDVTGRILYVNQPFLNTCQLAIEDGIGKTVFELFPADFAQKFLDNTQTVARTRQVLEVLEAAPRLDGTVGSYLVYQFPILDGAGQCFVGGVAVDITERKQMEDALFQEKELAQVTLQSIGEAVITTNAMGNIECLNPVAETLTGWNQQEAQGLLLTDVFNIVDEATRQPVENPVERALQQGQIVELANPTILLARDGRELAIDDSAAPIHNRAGEIIGAVLVFQDVTQTRVLSRQLAWHASHDALTGLVNRREFEQRLEQALLSAKTQNQNHALCYLDLDRFKMVNDTCGHAAGDKLLQQATALLQGQIRKTDILARLGGDEFGVLLHDCSIEQALRAANAMRECLQQFRFFCQGQSFTIGVSIGLVEVNSESESLASVLCAADAACYAAKNRGRNRVHRFQSNDAELLQQRGEVQWVARLTQALEDDSSWKTPGDRFCLYGQPIAAITESGLHIDHYEVLLRFQDQQGRIISPMVFMPAAERYNLMHRIDRWVIRTLFSQWTQIANHDRRIYAINLSGASINDDDFIGFLHEQFTEWQVPPSLICFEITETVAITNLTKANQFVQELQQLGCRFALDDFGSGMSSFSYLKNLSVDYLKIYGGFVQTIATDLADAAMVEAITRIGHAMGIKTIAEFVENDTILERIRALGVDYAQGYGVAKPHPFSNLLQGSSTQVCERSTPTSCNMRVD